MKRTFVLDLSPEAFLPDIHICKEIYCNFFQPEFLKRGLEKSFNNNFKGGKNGRSKES
ncbi:MAG: hypothetical protein OQK65_04030 [Chlorobium sp.]|nr:hypothetical protein [Chlorobium sp.]